MPSSLTVGDLDAKVKFMAEGAFNKVYKVETIAKAKALPEIQQKTGLVETIQCFKFVFRVTLPVDPTLKTVSEEGTMQYLRKHTTVPVQTILHSSSQPNNVLGFEWMLQTYAPGHVLSSIWEKLGDAGRERMTDQLATIQAELFKKAKFRGIGSIYRRGGQQAPGHWDQDSGASDSIHHYCVGQFVFKQSILLGSVIEIPNRGPFRTSAEWLSAQLEARLMYCKRLQESSDEDDVQEGVMAGKIAKRLLEVVPRLFPGDTSEEEPFLVHDDLSAENIFCREDGTITAILDWEATTCLPFWVACDLPHLLQGLGDWCQYEPDPARRAGGAESEVFRKAVVRWQRWKLLSRYKETMRRLLSEWKAENAKREHRESREHPAWLDFLLAVDTCDQELMWGKLGIWLKMNDERKWEEGSYVPLEDDYLYLD